MDGLGQDLRFALRTLASAPALTLASILTLALGIGAATAIGTAANLALMRPLPYPHGERLVHAGPVDADSVSVGNVGFATAIDWRARVRSFDELALIRSWSPTIVGGDGAERVSGMKVSWTFLRMLGVSPAIGRDFTAADDDPTHSQVVLISDALWRRRFGSRARRRRILDCAERTAPSRSPASCPRVSSRSSPSTSTPAPTSGRRWAMPSTAIPRAAPASISRRWRGYGPARPSRRATAELASVHAQLRREHPSRLRAARRRSCIRCTTTSAAPSRQPLRVLLAAVGVRAAGRRARTSRAC